MSKDWKEIARASGLRIPLAQLDAVAPTLAALEAAFRPLARKIPPESEPATVFQPAPEDGA
jgi:hypothetical protein